MKISLFSPYNSTSSAYGLRLIYNALKENGIPSKVFYYTSDFRNLYDDETLRVISQYLRDADIIGISLFTNHYTNAALLSEYIKKVNPKALIIWGGVHPIIRPEDCVKYADIVCVGEAEECFPQLCKRILTGQAYTDVPGFWYVDKKTGEVIKNSPCVTEDLNKIPFALYSEDHLLIDKDKLVPLTEIDLTYYTTLASRGCPFSCTYCVNNYYNKTRQNKIRRRNVDNLLEELKTIKDTHRKLHGFLIDDDAFFSMKLKYIKEFSEKYKNEINIPLYISGITPTTISKEKLDFLVDAGLNSIRIGFQSGSERVLQIYKRNYNQAKMLRAIEIAASYDLQVQLDIITDNPWETEEDTLLTIKLLDKAKGRFYLNIFNLVFFPGTELYEKAKNEGLIVDEKEEIYMMRYHTYKKNALNMTLELLSMRANYYLKLPCVIKFMLNNKMYNTKLYMLFINSYKYLNKINIIYYLACRFVKAVKINGWAGAGLLFSRGFYLIRRRVKEKLC